MIHAYNKSFLPDAMSTLGFSFDCAVNRLNLNADEYFDFFIASKIAEAFAGGSPKFISGMSGTELALEVLYKIGLKPEVPDNVCFSRSAEYWTGWILAYYQWKTAYSFAKIREIALASEIVAMYYPLHEADEEKFCDVMDSIIKQKTGQTNLQRLRKQSGLTQTQLAELSGVNLRTLQQYETRAKDINMASGKSINNLALALHCNFYDVMELTED